MKFVQEQLKVMAMLLFLDLDSDSESCEMVSSCSDSSGIAVDCSDISASSPSSQRRPSAPGNLPPTSGEGLKDIPFREG